MEVLKEYSTEAEIKEMQINTDDMEPKKIDVGQCVRGEINVLQEAEREYYFYVSQ